jgi:NADH-quinone oxidoreductase subunit L
MRLWMLAFSGSPRSEAAAHAHESPVVMTLPLWILAVPSVLLGGYLHFGNRFADFLTPTGQAPTEGVHLWLVAVTSLVAVGGIGLAWRIYRAPDPTGDPVVRMPGYALFVNLWYIDAFWKGIAANGVLAIGRSVAWFDRNVVDGAVNGVGTLCERSGYALRRTTNGQVQSYATVLVAALVIAALTLALSQTAPTPIHGAAISHTPGANR